ncbi:HAD-superfamily hydrolase [Halanaeroarchaeum sulfurireducens]|uniref:HAD-superfamily hydrolase n=2 Tax=Halanaeroarchaeum sulfurireducens TaxID=1604004 RepID=A0A0F7PAD1_9EURY|nr:HAD-superfamily hydrolase [Halanaeroarchaeum sulfurireducens]ALG82520.1 HAD-superfamily hydrolase [Halanaeroarchaeum sulfurireducens]
MVAAVVFDMDGVIVDTEQYWVEEEAAILDEALPADHDVDPHDITGINVHEQYEMLSGEYEMQVDREEYFDLFDAKAESVYARADLLEGFHDLLDALDERDLPLGVCTSSYPRWIEIVFESNDLQDRFDAVLSAAEEPVPGKPEPDLYERVADELGVEPEEMLVVEDSANGVAAAAAAGAYTIAYAANAHDGIDHSPADEVIDSAERLRERVLALVDGAE